MISSVSASPVSYPSGAESRQQVTDRAKAQAGQLSETDRKLVSELTKVDSKVRAHEAAHLAAAGGLAMSGASYGYETGPDGKRYAVSGEVQISLSSGRTPEETIARAQQIRGAALAPSDPSAQDMKVAAEATKMASDAQAELARQALASRYDTKASEPGNQIDTTA